MEEPVMKGPAIGLMKKDKEKRFNRSVARTAGISAREVRKLKKENRIDETEYEAKRIPLKNFKRLKRWK